MWPWGGIDPDFKPSSVLYLLWKCQLITFILLILFLLMLFSLYSPAHPGRLLGGENLWAGVLRRLRRPLPHTPGSHSAAGRCCHGVSSEIMNLINRLFVRYGNGLDGGIFLLRSNGDFLEPVRTRAPNFCLMKAQVSPAVKIFNEPLRIYSSQFQVRKKIVWKFCFSSILDRWQSNVEYVDCVPFFRECVQNVWMYERKFILEKGPSLHLSLCTISASDLYSDLYSGGCSAERGYHRESFESYLLFFHF